MWYQYVIGLHLVDKGIGVLYKLSGSSIRKCEASENSLEIHVKLSSKARPFRLKYGTTHLRQISNEQIL